MDNQHKHIKGYGDLCEKEIALINEVKETEKVINSMINNLQTLQDLDQRCVSIARTKFQEAFMWAVRSVAQPDDL